MSMRSTTARGPARRALQLDMARNHGLCTLQRAYELGATRALVQWLVATGEWIRVHEGVYRHRAAPPTEMQRLVAAWLGGGPCTRGSHLSAAWLWELLAAPPEQPHITGGSKRRMRGVHVHRSHDVDPGVVRRGVMVTSPARTVMDVAGAVRRPVAELVLDRAIARRLVTVSGLVAVLDRSGRRGRPGTGVLRAMLEERGVSCPARVASVLESSMARLTRRFGIPDPVAEHVPFLGAPYRFDFAWPEVKVAVEVDGYRFHSSYEAFHRGLARDRWCAEHGWVVLHFSWDDVRHRPEEVAAQILRVLAGRRVG